MRNKSVYLLGAVVCGTIAALGVGQWMEANQGTGELETTEIFVTAQVINESEEITANKIKLEQWPVSKVPQGASSELSDLEGRYAKQTIFAGEAVILAKLMDEKDDVIVPKGFKVVSMPANQKSGIVNLVKQGDRVDVDAHFTKSEVIPESGYKAIVTGAKVFAIDGKKKHDPEAKKTARSARTISLLIRKADLEAWAIAQKYGEITLSMGNPGEALEKVAEGEPSAAAKSLVTWVEDHKKEMARIKAEEAERKRREEEEKKIANAAKKESAETESPDKPKGDLFRTTKIVEGRMVVYEWTPGNPVPRIVADTGSAQTDLIEEDVTVDDAQTEKTPTDQDAELGEYEHLTGDESPFFQPGE